MADSESPRKRRSSMTNTVPDLTRRLSRASATASFANSGGGHGERFTSRFQFLIVLCGYAIGIGNLWRFPYLCGKFGGGSFLIPYIVGNIFVACPLLIYEVALGQHFQGGPETVFGKIGPRFASVAGMQWMLTVLLACYYPVVISYALSYAMYSLWPTSDGLLPWVTHNETSGLPSSPQDFWDKNILMGTDAIMSEGWWIPAPVPFIFLTVVWLVTCLVVIKGVETMAKIGTVMVFLPVLILLLFGAFVTTLEGASDGIQYYVEPNFTMLTSGEIWGVGISQVLFSLSPAMGPGMVFGACNDRTHSTVVSDIIIVTLANASFSIFGGFVIFSIIGFLAKQQNTSIRSLAGSGMGLAFVTIAEGVTQMPASRLVSFSFFFMLFMLGLDSLVPWAETVFHPFFEMYMDQKDFSRASIVMKGCFFMWLSGIPFTLRSGKHWMNIFDHYAPVYVLLGSALFEYLMIINFGTGKVLWFIKEMTTVQLPRFFVYQTAIAPFFLFAIMIYSLLGDIDSRTCTLPMVNSFTNPSITGSCSVSMVNGSLAESCTIAGSCILPMLNQAIAESCTISGSCNSPMETTISGNCSIAGEAEFEQRCPGSYLILNNTPVIIDFLFGWCAVLVPFGYVAYKVATYTPKFEQESAREIELA